MIIKMKKNGRLTPIIPLRTRIRWSFNKTIWKLLVLIGYKPKYLKVKNDE